jgi:hypothetical protein
MNRILLILISTFMLFFYSCDKNKEAKSLADSFYTALNAQNYVLLTTMVDRSIVENGNSKVIYKTAVLRNEQFGPIKTTKQIKFNTKKIDGLDYYFFKYKTVFEYKKIVEDLTIVYSNNEYGIVEYSFYEE